jgi:hypothetical protein
VHSDEREQTGPPPSPDEQLLVVKLLEIVVDGQPIRVRGGDGC